MSDEQKIIKQMKPHPLAYFFYYLIGLFFIVFSILASSWSYILIGLLIIILTDLVRRGHTYIIYETGVEKRFKFIIILKTYTDYSRIQDLSVERNLFDRIFGLGQVKINTAGSPGTEVSFYGIRHPEEIERVIRERLRH